MSKLFGKAKTTNSKDKPAVDQKAFSQKSEIIFTTIIGTSQTREAILTLSRNLKKNALINIDNEQAVIGKNAAVDRSMKTTAIMDYLKRASLIIVASTDLCTFLNDGKSGSIQIMGKDVDINPEQFLTKLTGTIKNNVIVVALGDDYHCIPGNLKDCEYLVLKERQPEVEISRANIERIVSALKRRNKQLGM